MKIKYLSIMASIFFVLYAFGCSENHEASNMMNIYYKTMHLSYNPFNESVEVWGKKLFRDYDYDSIVHTWDLGNIRVCILRKNNRFDTYFLEENGIDKLTSFLPIFSNIEGKQIFDPAEVMESFEQGNDIVKRLFLSWFILFQSLKAMV